MVQMRLLNPKEVAELLGGVAYENVLRMARSGALPSLKIGRRVRFVESEISEWIKKQKKSNAK